MNREFNFFLLFFFLLFSFSASGQTDEKNAISLTPKIVHYSRNDFKGDPQFWTMCENDDGTLIFGNNDGAIVFDGENWSKIYLPNNSSVRSIIKTKEGKIYAGGYNEFGTIQKNKFGVYFYKSLISEFHLDDKNIENLWQVHQLNNLILFRSFSEIIVINGNRATQLPANNSFLYSQIVNGVYLVQDAGKGIYKLNPITMTLELLFDSNDKSIDEIATMHPSSNPNHIALIAKSGNLFVGDISNKTIEKKSNLFDGVKKDEITYGIVDEADNLLLGTRNSKIIRITQSGKVIRANQMFANLSNATIHSLFKTKDKNIWVLQNNGVNFLDYKSPFFSIFDQASVYDILIKNDVLYIATDNGVYYSNFNINSDNGALDFKKVEDLQGQCWAIQEFENDILISHDTGIYKLNNGVVSKIGVQNGFWKINKIKNKQGLYLGSNYNGLYLIEKKGNDWTIKNKIKGFQESSRDIIADYQTNTYWICHGYKGVYKIHINYDYSRVDVVDHFTNKNGFESAYNINAFYWQNKIVFTSNTGIYSFNYSNNKFEPHRVLNKILDPTKNSRKLLERMGRTWFVLDDEAGYFDSDHKKIYKDLFLNMKGSFNRGIESIYPIDEKRVLFGTNTGVFLYTINDYKDSKIHPTVISKITYSQNQKWSLVEINTSEKKISLPNHIDILRFEFSNPKLISSTETNFSYKLENIDENWSSWQKNGYKEYTHLRPGVYTFIVKSRNLAGLKGQETRFNFTVLPKWYQTNLAYFIYTISSLLLMYYLITYVRKKIAFERIKSKIEVLKSQQLLELELEKLKLKQDKEEINKDRKILEVDIIDKSKELAQYTLLLSQKKNAFLELQNDLKQLKELLKSDDSKRKISEIFQKLNQSKIGEEYMNIFDVNFEKINYEFFTKLKQVDSSITKRELRLCAFVKMNLTNKEIAPLLNISIRGIESARYRVRKKLNVSHDDNFTAFLENL